MVQQKPFCLFIELTQNSDVNVHPDSHTICYVTLLVTKCMFPKTIMSKNQQVPQNIISDDKETEKAQHIKI